MNELMKSEIREVERIQYDGFLGETEEQQKERYKIKDINMANWAFRKLKAIEEQRQEYKDLLDSEVERLKMWYETETKALDNSKNFFESLLMEYYIEERELDPKFKLTTPYGKVSSRKQQPKWNYEDEKVLDWLRQNDTELIRIKEEINKAELKKKYTVSSDRVVTENGEIVEGITLVEQADSITVKVVE